MKTVDYNDWVSPSAEKNQKLPNKAGHDRCLVCEKPMKLAGGQVRLLTDGRITLFTGEVDQKLDQGWHDVGSDCFKRVSKLLTE